MVTKQKNQNKKNLVKNINKFDYNSCVKNRLDEWIRQSIDLYLYHIKYKPADYNEYFFQGFFMFYGIFLLFSSIKRLLFSLNLQNSTKRD